MFFIIIAELFLRSFKTNKIAKERFASNIKRFFKRIIRNKIGGELVVTGSDAVEIEFECANPHKVVAFFQNLQNKVPCNPEHTDHLEWIITRACCHRHIFKISWDVVGTRTITWRVTY